MKKWTIGGVPEHFNVPWQALVESREGPPTRPPAGPATGRRPLAWRNYPGGTGAMIDAIEGGEIDLAILLTEGAVAGRDRGASYEIISHYVTSPLIWGVHVLPESPFRSIDDLEQARFAVSRFGSGSHLMALALAESRGWSLQPTQFSVVGSLDGAIRAFGEGAADVFMWERFMTQPVVDRGEFRRLDDFIAPWAAFVTCARREIAMENAAELRALIDAGGAEALRFREDISTPERLRADFGIEIDQARRWLMQTRWSSGYSDPSADIEAAESMLRRAGAI